MAEEKKVKGALVNGYLKYVKKKWGNAGLQEVKARAGIERNIKDGEWVPVDNAVAVLEWIKNTKGESHVVDAGRHTAKDLGVFKYIIASFMSIERFIHRAQDTYNTLFNYGAIIIKDTDKGAIVTLRDSRDTDSSCLAWEGALKGIMEVTRTHGTVTPIEPDAPEDCKFEMVWKS
ncbi:MAG: hypothetical protein GXO25_05400 [Euryarchaeota archaeon]|nr:hypothetical protein [Euryarchaeota archaeon]